MPLRSLNKNEKNQEALLKSGKKSEPLVKIYKQNTKSLLENRILSHGNHETSQVDSEMTSA